MRNRSLLSSAAFIFSSMPSLAFACACGCGVFDVQSGPNFPTDAGGTVWAEYDFMNQNVNWSGTSSSSAANNDDKVIRTHFIDVGGEYMFNRSWGIEADVPYWDRYFKTTDDSGNLASFNHDNFGDAKINGVYTGFSADMSTGVTFGLKLPTGDWKYSGFDRDTEIGSGSTDLLLGAYHMDKFAFNQNYGWFLNSQIDQPFLISAGYRPGSELDAAGGVYYEGWHIGSVQISPVMSVLGSYRLSDRGPAADPDDSGYKRVLFAPGMEISQDSWHIYSDVALPVYQDITGNQLTAPVLFKIALSHDF